MGQITLDYNDAMRILQNPDASPDAKVIAGCTVAFFQTNNHADEIDPATRPIVLKLSHMTAAAIYDMPTSGDPSDEEE